MCGVTLELIIFEKHIHCPFGDMGSKRATYQVHDDSQTLGKYTIGVRVRVKVRVRVQLAMEQQHELRIYIN